MTIEEINNLINDEDNGTLRKPKTIKNKTDQELLRAREIMTIFVQDIIENSNRHIFLNSLIGRRFMQVAGIKKFDDVNPSIRIYSVKTRFGDGLFFDAHRLYEDGKYPFYIKPGFCYGNAYAYVAKNNVKAKVVSGIAYLGKPFLHSVVLTGGGQVIDFNYNLVMNAELYFKLLNFEVLAELEGDKIKETYELLENNADIYEKYNIQSYTLNFAFDDVLKLISEENNKNLQRINYDN